MTKIDLFPNSLMGLRNMIYAFLPQFDFVFKLFIDLWLYFDCRQETDCQLSIVISHGNTKSANTTQQEVENAM